MHLTAYLGLLMSRLAASTAWPGDHLTGQHCAPSVIEQWVWGVCTLRDFATVKPKALHHLLCVPGNYIKTNYAASNQSPVLELLVPQSATVPQRLCREHASEISVQIVSKMPYDEDMKRKYAKHLKTTERYAAQVWHSATQCEHQKPW